MECINSDLWLKRDTLISSDAHQNLLQEVYDVNLPGLQFVNYMAFKKGGKYELTVNLRGLLWKQKPNKYHGKCARQYHASYNSLSPEDKTLSNI